MTDLNQFYDLPKNLGLLGEESSEAIKALLPLNTSGFYDHTMTKVERFLAVEEAEVELADFIALAQVSLPMEMRTSKNFLCKLTESTEVANLKDCAPIVIVNQTIVNLCLSIQTASKGVRFGLYHRWPDEGITCAERLQSCIAGVISGVVILDQVGVLNLDKILSHVPAKYERLAMHYQGFNTGGKTP